METCVVVKLPIRVILPLVLLVHSHRVSGQLYVLVTVHQGKGPPVPPGQESCWSFRADLGAMAGRNNPGSAGNN